MAKFCRITKCVGMRIFGMMAKCGRKAKSGTMAEFQVWEDGQLWESGRVRVDG